MEEFAYCIRNGPDTGVEPVLNEYESFVLPIYESGTRASYVNRTHIPGVQNPCTSHCTKEAYKMCTLFLH